MARVAAVLVLVLLVAGCGSRRAVAVHVTPGNSVEDQPIQIVVDGLRPHQIVALRLRSTDTKGVAFGAKATFAADAHGIVDVDHASARTGSAYSGVWPMGLLTSMSAPSAPPFTPYFWGKTPQRFTLTASVAGRAVASTTFRRGLPDGRFTVEDETVPKDGFDGFYYAPAGASRRPAVLMFGGSEGGVGRSLLGALLAAHGVPTLDIGYFHAPGLPSALKNIPLEYFRGALEWLDRRPQVDPSRVSVLGVSRGSEAALLLGVHYPQL
ncbi:MAG TPA: acyl-CoA thioesterase/BAAT N-terminal domain-containing protein, partial [Gaiellaceae bacterium]|nr:acyl-CoA thioesterase/BAAT N-terminal domain-containing protein [Gaiellaceae bacterium]